MSDILDHPSMQDRRIELVHPIGLLVVPVKLALGKGLHDAPELIHILLAVCPRDIIADNHKAMVLQIGLPSGSFLKAYAILLRLVLIQVHGNNKRI